MARSTRGRYAPMKTAYQVLGSAERRYTGIEGDIGKLRADIDRANRERRKRLLLIQQAIGVYENVISPIVQRQADLTKGAERMSIQLPEEGVFKQIGTVLSGGPDPSREYSYWTPEDREIKIPGSYLTSLEEAYQEGPMQGQKYQEYLETLFEF